MNSKRVQMNSRELILSVSGQRKLVGPLHPHHLTHTIRKDSQGYRGWERHPESMSEGREAEPSKNHRNAAGGGIRDHPASLQASTP